MLTKIPQYLVDQQEQLLPEVPVTSRVIKFSDLLEIPSENEPVQVNEERVKLVSDHTKRIYASVEENGKKTARVLDCVSRQLYYEKQCEQVDFDNEKKNIMLLFEKFGDKLDDVVNVVRDFDDQELRVYYENGIITLSQVCDYHLKEKIYWFDQENKLKNIFKSVFANLHVLFEESFYYGNISMDSIVFCKQKDGQLGLAPKLLDLGQGSFDFMQIPEQYQLTIEVNSDEDRKILELQILGQIFEEIMLESIIEYENNLLIVFKDIAQKPQNYTEEPDLYSSPEEKFKKIRQYYSKDIIIALDAIRSGADYGEIVEYVSKIDVDLEDIQSLVFDEENIFHKNLMQKVCEIQKDINNKEELFAYLQILKNLDLYEVGVNVIQSFLEKFPYKENTNLLYEALYFYRMAKKDCTPLGQEVQTFIDTFKKDKNEYFKLKIFTCFTCENPDKLVDCHQESVDHFQLADDPISFAWIQYMLGQVYTILNKKEFAAQFLQKAGNLYDNLNIEDDEKGLTYELYAQYIDDPNKRCLTLNKAYKVFQQKKLFEGQRYAKLMELYGDAIKDQAQYAIQQQFQKQQSQQQDETAQTNQTGQGSQPPLSKKGSQLEVTGQESISVDYDSIYDFYQCSSVIYTYSLGKNNQESFRIKKKICNTLKYFSDLSLYIQNVIEYLLMQKQDKDLDLELITELTTLVVDQEQLQQAIQFFIIDKASIYERSLNFLEAQSLLEIAITLLNSFENTIIDQIKYRLEILRLKHMYQETNKEFLVIEGYEKSDSIDDKNYFFKRWNINLINNNDLKTALKSVDQNMISFEDQFYVSDFCESLILRSAIFKKLEKFDKAEENILKANDLIEQQGIYYLQNYVKDQILYIKFLAQQQLENKLQFNQRKYQKMLKAKSCQEQEILRLQMNCAFIHELQNDYKQSKDILKSVLVQSNEKKNNQVKRTASTTMNRIYEKKLMAQLEKQQNSKRPSTAF